MSINDEDTEIGSGDSNPATERKNPRDDPAYYTPYEATS
ncbi:hypothetical protein AVEN_176246-1, partial [Araneus ventricosus]